MSRQLALSSTWLALALSAPACKHAPAEPAAPAEDSGASASADAGEMRPPKQGFWRDAVFYEIFVRSFADSNGDGTGDLAGLTAKLDALNDGDPETKRDLGVNGIWLMPIHPSPSYHGYDVTDYTAINPAYGSLADFDAFLAAAHQRGIKVIIDFVLNHSSREHPWFKASSAGPSAPERSFYRWRADDPGWTQPWGSGHVWHPLGGAYYYGIFWSGMPDLNLGNPEIERRVLDAMRFWLARGVDGFRVDAVRHLFESADGQLSDQPEAHAFSRRMRAALEREHPSVLLVAEAWTSLATVSTYYGAGDEYHLAFGFDTAAALKTAAKDGLRADFNLALTNAERSYTDRGFEAPFLSNHDMTRVMRELGGDPGAMRVAASALFALPGTPFLYYGEEIGMQGGATPADEDKRTPMRWTPAAPGYGFTTAARAWREAPEAAGIDVESQRDDPGSLWSLYRDLIGIRRSTPALAIGAASRPTLTGGGRGTTALLRSAGAERVLFVVNFHTEASGAFDIAIEGAPEVLFAEGLDGRPTANGEQIHLSGLAPRGFAFLRL